MRKAFDDFKARGALQRTSPAAPTWRCADCGAEPPIKCTDHLCVHYTGRDIDRITGGE
jgi:hypothetical protein